MSNIALLFPGQSSQYVGMGKYVYDKYGFTRPLFEEANDILGFDIKKLCFEGLLQELTLTQNAQPAILLCSFASYMVLKQEFGMNAKVAAGHSIGEISALTCAGALSFANAIKIVRQRGICMQNALQAGKGKMAALTNINLKSVEELCNKIKKEGLQVEISNFNAPEQIVVSGLDLSIDRICSLASDYGATAVPLNVSAPFHSSYMQVAADGMEFELKKYIFKEPEFPVLSNVDGESHTHGAEIANKLVSQITGAVRWDICMKNIPSYGVDLMIEVGPKNVLKNLAAKNKTGIKCLAIDLPDDFNEIKKTFAVTATETKRRITLIDSCLGIAVSTRNKNWDEQEYKVGVIEQYRKIAALQQQMEVENRKPSLDEMEQSLVCLKTILITKKTPETEINHYLEKVLQEADNYEFLKAQLNQHELIAN